MHVCAAERVVEGPPDGFAAVAFALVGGEDVDADFGPAVVLRAEGVVAEVDLADGGAGAGGGGTRGCWEGVRIIFFSLCIMADSLKEKGL